MVAYLNQLLLILAGLVVIVDVLVASLLHLRSLQLRQRLVSLWPVPQLLNCPHIFLQLVLQQLILPVQCTSSENLHGCFSSWVPPIFRTEKVKSLHPGAAVPQTGSGWVQVIFLF